MARVRMRVMAIVVGGLSLHGTGCVVEVGNIKDNVYHNPNSDRGGCRPSERVKRENCLKYLGKE